MKGIYRPTLITLVAIAATIAAISGTTGYILGRAPYLPQVLPISFDDEGIANRFVRASYPIVLVPVWIQLTLACLFGAIVAVLLHRARPVRSVVEDELGRQHRERMLVTAEAVSLLAAVWVGLQGLMAIRLIFMWQMMCCGLGSFYYQSLVVCIILSVVIGIRAAVYSEFPTPPRSADAVHWRAKGFYVNRQDPAMFVPLPSGAGWTLNFGRPQAVVLAVLIAAFVILAPVAIFRVLLGE